MIVRLNEETILNILFFLLFLAGARYWVLPGIQTKLDYFKNSHCCIDYFSNACIYVINLNWKEGKFWSLLPKILMGSQEPIEPMPTEPLLIQLHCKPFHCKNCRFPLCPFSHCSFTAVWAVIDSMQWTTVLQFEKWDKLNFLQLDNCNSNNLAPAFTAP